MSSQQPTNHIPAEHAEDYARYVAAGESGLLGDGPTTFEAWQRGEYAAAAQPAARFTKIHDAAGAHIITRDEQTGLEWSARDIGRFTNAAEGSKAEAACAALELGGHTDWRMPTIEELESIRDLSRHSPAIDTDAFPDCPSAAFWASTPHAYGPDDYAWFVDFDGGHSGFDLRDGRGYYNRVRAVRGPARQSSAVLGG